MTVQRGAKRTVGTGDTIGVEKRDWGKQWYEATGLDMEPLGGGRGSLLGVEEDGWYH